MFKDIKDLELTIIKEKPGLYNTYNFYNGKTIDYSLTSIAIVRNPYKNGKLDFAVKPYFKNDSGKFVPVYSYQEDIQYQEYRRIINECKRNCNYIPSEVDAFVKEMVQKKCEASKWANLVLSNALEETQQVVNAHFSKQAWRDIITASDIAKQLMAEAVESLK